MPFDTILRSLQTISGRFEFRSRRVHKLEPDSSKLRLVNEIFIWEKDTNAFGDLLALLNKVPSILHYVENIFLIEIRALEEFPLSNLRYKLFNVKNDFWSWTFLR